VIGGKDGLQRTLRMRSSSLFSSQHYYFICSRSHKSLLKSLLFQLDFN